MRKLRTKFILPGVLLASVPLAVGCSSKTVTETAVETTTAVTTAETTQTTEPTTTAEPEPIKSYKLKGGGGFNEGRAWVYYLDDDNEERLGVIDDNGKLIYTLKKRENHSKNYTIDEYKFQNGLSCIYSCFGDGHGIVIVDKEGNELYVSPDSETETYDLIGRNENYFLVVKRTKTYSENSKVMYLIDKTGRVVSDIIDVSDETLGGSFEQISGSYYLVGDFKHIVDFDSLTFKQYDRQNTQRGYWDNDGKLIVQEPYFEGVTYVEKGDFFWWGEKSEEKCNESGYYDENYNLITKIPSLPETVEIEWAHDFNGGFAFLELKGADYKSYITLINKNGEMQYEPIQARINKDFNRFEGYAVLKDYKDDSDENFTGYYILTPKGEIKKLGQDDLSDMGNDAYIYYSTQGGHFILVSGGFANKYVSLDAKKTITTADMYE